jgi:microcystin-dependent protein
MDGYLAQILFFAGNFPPKFWAFCEGQILSITSNTALYSLLGTTFGGNGTTTFGLPDFRGRVPVGWGQGPGLTNINLGEILGSPTATLSFAQMPAHTHVVTPAVAATSTNGSSASPVGNIFAATAANGFSAAGAANGSAAAGSLSINIAGGSQPFSIQQPTLSVNFVICLYGAFPSRN